MLNYIKFILDKINSFIYIFSIIFIFAAIIVLSAILFFLYFIIYYPIYNSFNLVEVDYSTKNPIEFFELNKKTNITFIASYYNITNLTIIFEQYKNVKNFLNNKINFTSINKDIPFESDYINYKILSTISVIFETVNLIILINIFLNDNYNYNCINSTKQIFCLIIIIIFYVFSIIFTITILIIINRLRKSLSEFYSLIENLFNIKIQKFIWDEVFNLTKVFVSECINISFIILVISIIYVFCKISVDQIRTNSFIDRLIGLN